MKNNILLWALVLVFGLACTVFVPKVKAQTTPLVGVIRFDVWDSRVTIAPDPTHWGPQMWNYRLPYYAKWGATTGKWAFNGMDQGNIDKEIQIAAAAGISYFAFDYYTKYDYDPPSQPPDFININYGLRRYLTSTVNSNVKFNLVIVGGDPLGDKTTWATSQVPRITTYTHNPKYQTVLGGRALVYFFGVTDYPDPNNPNKPLTGWPKVFGSRAGAKAALTTLRQQIRSATGKDPYFVTMDYPATPDDVAYFGFNARSSYLGLRNFSPVPNQPYHEIATQNQTLWANYSLRYQVIPLVSAGYDQRPRKDPSLYNNMLWFRKARPEEIALNLHSAIEWVKANPAKTEANSILMYAWNESMEGGWITPTLFEGDARLQAISNVIDGHGFTTPRVGGVDLKSDNKIDIFDYKLIVEDFGKTGSNVTGDIDKNGKVDIFDYNILVENFGK